MAKAKGIAGVGSMIRVKDSLLMVCGYRVVDEDGHVGLAHLAVPYPYGFVGEESLVVLTDEVDREVVFEGYESDESIAMQRLLADVKEQGREVAFGEYVEAMGKLVASEDEGVIDE